MNVLASLDSVALGLGPWAFRQVQSPHEPAEARIFATTFLLHQMVASPFLVLSIPSGGAKEDASGRAILPLGGGGCSAISVSPLATGLSSGRVPQCTYFMVQEASGS